MSEPVPEYRAALALARTQLAAAEALKAVAEAELKRLEMEKRRLAGVIYNLGNLLGEPVDPKELGLKL